MNVQQDYTQKSERLHLIDHIRWMVYLAIASFHFMSTVWSNRGYVYSGTSVLWWASEQYSRTFADGGQIILLLTFLLMGFRADAGVKLKRIVVGAAVGAFMMALADFPENQSFLIWDIYPLIFLGALTLLVVSGLGQKAVFALAAVGFLMLQFSFWEMWPLVGWPLELRAALVGDCNLQFANWPVLPWIGLIWLAFGLGQLAFRYLRYLKRVMTFEPLLWGVILIWGFYNFNSYRFTPDDVKWACFVFRRPPLEFLSQLFLYTLVFRFAVLTRVQTWVARFKVSVWVERLWFSRSFGVFYVLHYLVMSFSLHLLGRFFIGSPEISFAVFVLQLVFVELVMRVVAFTLLKTKA